ncbi:MAG: UMP kinase [Puniceicoccales bacterium]|jgi:uridylate kinase|nr:UMP kinase [Puniceicoccales bacterium]
MYLIFFLPNFSSGCLIICGRIGTSYVDYSRDLASECFPEKGITLKGYRRVIIKFSGEVLKDKANKSVINFTTVYALCEELKILHGTGLEIGVVMGGGNIFRGMSKNEKKDYDRLTGDYIGMLATIINSMAIADFLRKLEVAVEVFSALPMLNICETYYPRYAQKAMGDGKIVLLAGGTGSAFFSTDSAAALRASELHADVIIKATKVDGVYDKDPKHHRDAAKFDKISFQEVLLRHLQVMDSTAFSLCMDNNIPILIVDAQKDLKNIRRAVQGEIVGTTISNF